MRDDSIDVYLFDLDPGAAEVALLFALMSPAERARAGRYKADEHARRFIVRRGRLRQVLAAHCEQAPARIHYYQSEQGKPALLVSDHGPTKVGCQVPAATVHFNTSSSGDDGLIGVSHAAPLGVDIERKKEMTDRDAVVRRFFSAAEQHDFVQVPEADKCQAFFNAWTRKEAVIKATGEGLRTALDSFDVTLIPGQPARLLRMAGTGPGAGAGVRDWRLFDLNVGEDCVGALAMHLPESLGERLLVRLHDERRDTVG